MLDGCWFQEENAPSCPHHPYCHCTLDPIPYAVVLMNTTSYSDYSKFDPYGKRMGHLLFKLSVDQNLMGNILAADIEIDPDQLRKARVRCVKEVKETNGEISFEDTVRYQKGAE